MRVGVLQNDGTKGQSEAQTASAVWKSRLAADSVAHGPRQHQIRGEASRHEDRKQPDPDAPQREGSQRHQRSEVGDRDDQPLPRAHPVAQQQDPEQHRQERRDPEERQARVGGEADPREDEEGRHPEHHQAAEHVQARPADTHERWESNEP